MVKVEISESRPPRFDGALRGRGVVVVYKSREDRDRIAAAVRVDPELKAQMDPSKMPFDAQRMLWNGFQTIVGLSPRH